MPDTVLISEELPVADGAKEPLNILGRVRVVAQFVLNQQDLTVEFYVAQVAGITIAADMQPDMRHVGISMDSTLRTVRTLVEELLIRVLLLMMSLKHSTSNEDQAT